ncbi:Target of rapamycin complex subunit lst8, partial [Perkinsus olseni]
WLLLTRCIAAAPSALKSASSSSSDESNDQQSQPNHGGPQTTPSIERFSEFGDSFTEDAESSSWVPLNVLDAHDAYVLKIRFAPGPARLLATCSSDGTAQIWQSHSDGFSRQCGFNGHPRWVWDCAFGADRRSFYTAC